MQDVTVAQAILTISVVLAGLGALWKLARWGRPIIRRLEQFLDDFYGSPARPGVAARPGLMERLATVEQQTSTIAYNVTPNHGHSAHDQQARRINAVGDQVAELQATVEKTIPFLTKELFRNHPDAKDRLPDVSDYPFGNETRDNGNENRTNIEQEGP